jgi:hypothetical protein
VVGADSPADYIPRYLSLFDIVQEVRQANDADLLTEFQTATGLSLTEFVWIGITLFALAIGDAEGPRVFDPLLLSNSQVAERLPDVLTRPKIEAALRLLARVVQGHRAELTRRGAPAPGVERYAVNVLARRPLVAVPGGYIAPSPWLLVQRVTSGLFFDFLEPREGKRKEIQAFTSSFGRAFERYVGEELAALWSG